MLQPADAMRELETAYRMNPGPWREHSISAAENAKRIAEKIPDMDAETAYVMGLLHDIGRRAGVAGIRHIFDGYDYMMRLGEPEIARICLTHSFPLPDVRAFSGRYDCSEEQLAFLKRFLAGAEYNDYDRLIQLCDAISLPGGACIMEKRLVDVALRHGLHDGILDKWRAFMELKTYFDKRCQCSIYTLLPDVIEHSLEN
ncbi:MAG: HD domain-containing protein [Eubacteriales bacterium]